MSATAWSPRRLLAVDDAQVQALADVLVDCVEGGASVSFLHPLTRDRAESFWRRVAEGVAAGERALLVAEDAGGICGTVQLVLAQPENQPHRADLVKMLVHRRARRRGLGAALMRAAEGAARECGKTLLVLDAVTGGDAERLYGSLGWVRVGVIPRYALMPRGAPCGTTLFYRDLDASPRGVATGRVPWMERRWTFVFPAGNHGDVLERLRGTPARLEERLSGAAADARTRREGGVWSAQENAGHLLDVEELWAVRTQEILAGARELRAADPSNARTVAARHNEADLRGLLARFRAARTSWVERLSRLSPRDFARSSLHPRLKCPMRLVDLCIFVADHDDHHLARIAALLGGRAP
jgi:GNAT superfamily N-acetyltransferase/uncharacterized damage-inducible protein DinB